MSTLRKEREVMADKLPYHGCKFLDYDEGKYPDCTLMTHPSDDEPYRWWHRNILAYPEAPINVQFCRLRGRINQMARCWDPGDQDCWTPQDHL